MGTKAISFLQRLRGLFGSAFDKLKRFSGTATPRGTRHTGLGNLLQLEDRRLLSATPIGTEFRVNTTTVGTQQLAANTTQSVAMAPTGGYVATWQGQDANGWGIFAQRYNAAGVAQGGELPVNTTTAGDQLHPAVAVDGTGNFVVTWASYGQDTAGTWGIYARLYNSAGVAQTGEILVNQTTAGNQTNPAVAAAANGTFVVTWSTDQNGNGGDTYARLFQANGSAAGGEFRVNPANNANNENSAIAMDGAGDFVVVWRSNDVGGWQVFAQRFTPLGAALGSEVQVSSGGSNQQDPTVAMDAGGNFTVAWDSNQTTPYRGIVARSYASSATALGGEYVVNAQALGDDQSPSVAYDGSGQVLVAWDSYNQDAASSHGIYAQEYTTAGAVVGAAFRVNTTTAGDQQTPAVASNAKGDTVIAWSGNGTGDTAGVFAQAYATTASGIAVSGSTFLVATDNSVVRLNALSGTVVATYATGLANDGLASGADGSLYVADYYNNRINHYDATGALLSSFGTTNTPQGLTFGPDGNLYVTTTSSTVERYSPAGASLGTFISAGSGGLSNAKAITWGPDGNAYVSSYSNSEVIRYNGTTGAFLNVFATGTGGFEDITFGPDKNLYVASYGDGNVYRYNGTTGAPLGAFASGISTAYGLRFDPAGNLDVSSRSSGLIQTYNGSTGAFLGTLASGLTNPAYITAPTSLVTTEAGTSASFSVALTFQPTADVTINLSSTMPAQGTLSQSTLVFKVASWNTPQTVTVTGLDDHLINGDQTYQITGTATSADANYNGLGMAPVTIVNQEEDVNKAPVLNPSISPALAPEVENQGFPVGAVGTLVSSLVSFPGSAPGNVTDPNPAPVTGIAVTAADTTNGSWWYSLDNGSTWNALGSVSEGNARLLPADAVTRVYFQPGLDYNGSIPAALTFHAWDQTSGTPGVTAFLSSSGTVLDGFSTVSYSNNDGTANWNGSWVENDSGAGGASGGRIFISNGQLDIRANTAGNWIYRSANLAGATTATLSFNYNNALGGGDSIVVQVSTDGGATYTTLPGGTFSNSLHTGAGSVSFDLTSYAAADTRVRFFVNTVGSKNNLFLDNVQIAYATIDTGGGTAFSAATESASLLVTPVNQPPVNLLPAPQSTNEDTPLVLSAANGNALATSDVDAGNAPVQVTLTASQGTLTLTPLIGPEFQVNTTTASDQLAPRSAVAADGHYVVVWQSNNQDLSNFGIYARVYNADGTPQTGEIAVNTTTLDAQTAPAIAIDSSGQFVIAWQSHNSTTGWDIYARSFNAAGTALSPETRINNTTANDQTAPAVAMDGAGNIVIAWQSKGQDNLDGSNGIYARRYTVNLANQGNEFLVNTTTLDDQTSPAVARDATTGDFVIVWQSHNQDGSGWGVYGQRYTSAGARVGGEFQVNTTTANDQLAPAVAMNAGGNFIVAWQSQNQDGSGFGIYAQRYDSSGAPVGGEFQVNTTTANDQTAPTVALADNGYFAVAWSSKGQDNPDGKEGVYVQAFAADGTPRGQEFRANTTTLGAQTAPSIGLSPDEKVFVVWQSQNQDGNGWGVYGQLFKTPGALTFLVGDGNADSTMTFLGTIPDINSYLDGMSFTPLPNYNGPASITITTNDLGNTGSGGPLSDTSVLPINVIAVNDPPTQTIPAAQVINEDTPIVFSSANGMAITVADIDADPNPVQVTLSAPNGMVKFASTNGLTVVSGADGSGSVTVQGTLADLNADLDGLVYTPAANYFGTDTLTVTTNDLGHTGIGGPLSVTGSVAITINSVNDPPVNGLPATQSVVDGNVLVFSQTSGNALTLGDVDALGGVEEVTLDSTHGTLKLASTNNLSFSAGTGKGGETRMTFRGTLTAINNALSGMSFTPASGYAGPAYLEFISNDLGNSGAGGSLGDRDVLLINVTPNATNSAPVITVPGNQTTLEETPLVLSQANGNLITVNDDAGGNPVSVTLTATGGTLSLAMSTGPEFQVNSTVLNDQSLGRVGADAAGDYVVVWQSQNQDGSGWGVYGQLYNSIGLALAPEFQVNTTTANDQMAPAVAMDAAGDFVVTWQSKNQDGDGWGIYAQRYNAAGVAQGSEFRVNSTTTNDQMAPAVAMDSTGDFVVTWQSKNQDGDGWGIYAQGYNAAGVAHGSEFRVNSTTTNDQMAPAVAMDSTGDFVVTWQSKNQDGDGFGIYAQRYNAGGVAQGGEFQVNTIGFKDQTNPAIAMDGAGAFVIAWQSPGDYPDNHFGIYPQRYDAAGVAQGGQFLVNTTTPNDQTNPSATMDAAGNFIIAWQSMNQDNQDHQAGIYAQRFDSSGARAGGEFLVNTTTIAAQTSPSIAYRANGKFVAVWTSDQQDGSGLGIFGQQFLDPRYLNFTVGTGVGDATMTFLATLDQINDALNGLVYTPNLNFDGNGRLTISVNDLGNSGAGGPKTTTKQINITVQPVNDPPIIQVPAPQTFTEDTAVVFSQANGNAITINDVDAGNGKLLVTLTASVGALTLANTTGLTFQAGAGAGVGTMTFTGTLSQIAAALNGMQLSLPAHFTGDVSVHVFVNDQGNTGAGGPLTDAETAFLTVTPDATNAAPQVMIPGPQYTPQDTPLSLSNANGNAPSVVDDAGTNPVTATLTVANGVVSLSNGIGPETLVNPYTASNQDSPSLAMMPDGDYIVVWTSQNQDGSGLGVYAQRFNAAGLTIGPVFQVNTTTANDQWAPVVAVNSSGEFVVVWVSANQDGSGQGVYGQRFDANGNPLGTEFLVNTTVQGDQFAPAVAMNDSGAFVVAWQNNSGSQGIFAQLYDANGQEVGGEFQVNTVIAGNPQLPRVAMDGSGNVIVAWQGQDANSDGIFAQRYDATGAPVGGQFQVNTTTAGAQDAPAIAMNAGGAFTIVWQGPEAGGGGGATGIFGQRYDSTGAPVGSEFLVNTTSAGNQVAPDVAIDAAGEFVVTWQGPDANGQGVFAQVYRADGSALGREVQVNTTTQGNQVAPSVGMAADGTYTVAWTGDNLGGNNTGIDSQRMRRGDELTLTSGTGVNDSLVTMTGTLANINAALDGLVFTPTAGFNGVATIQIDVNDLGNTGAGGPLTGTATVDIVVGRAPVLDLDANDSSGILGSGFANSFHVGVGAVAAADTDATLVDATTGNLASLTVTITNLRDAGAETLAANVGGTHILSSYNAATGVLSLTGGDTVANYQKVLRTVTYNDSSASPDPADRSITFVAYDGHGTSNVAVATIHFAGLNQPPVAVADSYSVAANSVLTVAAAGVLANDSDPNSDPITASLVSGPTNGTLTLNLDGSFTYTPSSGFSGSDSFSYRAYDGQAYSSPVTVAITVTPVRTAPTAANDSYSVTENSSLNVPAAGVLGNDFDSGGNPLTAALVSNPASGTLVLNPDGSFTYSPDPNFFGTDSFTYQATNGFLNSNVATVSLTVNPLPPVAANDSFATNVNTSLNLPAVDLLGNDTDPQNLPLSAVFVSGPNNGTVTVNPDGSFTYTPNPNFFGADSFTYEANNGYVGSNVATVSLTVNALPPAAADDSFSTSVNTALDITAPGVLGNDTDPQALALTAILVTGPGHGSLTLSTDGSLQYTPAPNYTGPDGFTYKANDGLADSNVATVNLTVNALPGITVTPTSLQTSMAGASASFGVQLDTQPTFQVTINLSSTNPGEGTLSQTTLTFDGTNWNVPQTVTVTGQLDPLALGDVTYQINGTAASGDGTYNLLTMTPVTVTNVYVATPGFIVNPPTLTTSEAGASASFSVALNTAPIGTVTLHLTSGNPAQGTLSASDLTFNLVDWNVPQTVTVTGLDDGLLNGDQTFQVTGIASSPDPLYDRLTITPVNVLNQEADVGTSTVVVSSGGPSVYGQAVTFTATVSAAGAGTPTGTVTFFDGSTSLATVALVGGTAGFTTSGLAAGSHVITAAYNGAYLLVPSVSSPLAETVAAATLTVTTADASKVYGQANPGFAAGITGFVNGDTISAVSGNPDLRSAATPASGVGSYAITAAQGTLSAANYTFTFVDGTLTVTPAALTVTAADATKVYGDPNPAFSATITGFVNGDTAAAVSGSAALSSAATAASGVGSYGITAAQGTLSAANYTFALADGTLTVTPARLTVTAADATRVYGQGNPAFGDTLTGFVNGDRATVVSGVAALSTTASASSGVGSYAITAGLGTLSAANYTFSFLNGTLTVTPATLTVTAADATKVYGQPDPTFSDTITGFVNGDTAAVVSGNAALSTTATTSSRVGSYAMTAAQGTLSAANYIFNFAGGTLTVTPATLTVTASDVTKVYGSPNPVFDDTITGFVNGDTAAVVSGSASLSTTASASSSVGSYAITAGPGTFSAANYTFAFADGTLTVTPATLTVTANDATRTYGEANPPFTATYSGLVNGDTGASLGGTLTFSTTTTVASPAGSYAVTPGGLVSANYAIAFLDGLLTITPAPAVPDSVTTTPVLAAPTSQSASPVPVAVTPNSANAPAEAIPSPTTAPTTQTSPPSPPAATPAQTPAQTPATTSHVQGTAVVASPIQATVVVSAVSPPAPTLLQALVNAGIDPFSATLPDSGKLLVSGTAATSTPANLAAGYLQVPATPNIPIQARELVVDVSMTNLLSQTAPPPANVLTGTVRPDPAAATSPYVAARMERTALSSVSSVAESPVGPAELSEMRHEAARTQEYSLVASRSGAARSIRFRPDVSGEELAGIGEELEASDPLSEAGTYAVSAVVATAGYVLLNTRTGYWLLSLLTARPLWQHLDPLEVLYAWEKERGAEGRVGDEETKSLLELVHEEASESRERLS